MAGENEKAEGNHDEELAGEYPIPHNRCYITTACVRAEGLPYCCLELKAVREVREHIRRIPDSRGNFIL